MKIEKVYVTKKTFPDGEISVMGHKEDGTLAFGFRTRNYWGWRNQARDWARPRLAVFDHQNKGLCNVE